MDPEALLQIFWLVVIIVWAVASRFLRRGRAADEAPLEPDEAGEMEEAVERTAPDTPQAPMGDFGDLLERLREALAPPEPAPVPEATDESAPAIRRMEPQPAEVGDEAPAAPAAPPMVASLEPRAGGAGSPRRRGGSWLTRELRGGGRSLARAIVLREVLGPPVALRSAAEPAPFGRRDDG